MDISVVAGQTGKAAGTATRTAVDYETLRRFALEGIRAEGNVEYELAFLMTQGVAAWLETNAKDTTTWAKPHQRYYAEDLSVLLANIFECSPRLTNGRMGQ